jgi:hypothetical protein
MAFAQEIFHSAKVLFIHRKMLLELCPITRVRWENAAGKNEAYRAWALKLGLDS